MNLSIKLLRGNTAKNDLAVLDEGKITVDTERMALRIHDGVTPGGWVVQAYRAVTANSVLLAGDATLGWYGEVQQADFTTIDILRNSVGLINGDPINSDTTWLKLSVDGKTLYTPKLPILADVSYNDLVAADLALGDSIAFVDGRQYKLRLFKGATINIVTGSTGGAGSEWDRVFAALTDGTFASMSEATLGLTSVAWTRETDGSTNAAIRGGTAYIDFDVMDKDTDIMVVWRPVLEEL
jgi:hypothetical protein